MVKINRFTIPGASQTAGQTVDEIEQNLDVFPQMFLKVGFRNFTYSQHLITFRLRIQVTGGLFLCKTGDTFFSTFLKLELTDITYSRGLITFKQIQSLVDPHQNSNEKHHVLEYVEAR